MCAFQNIQQCCGLIISLSMLIDISFLSSFLVAPPAMLNYVCLDNIVITSKKVLMSKHVDTLALLGTSLGHQNVFITRRLENRSHERLLMSMMSLHWPNEKVGKKRDPRERDREREREQTHLINVIVVFIGLHC